MDGGPHIPSSLDTSVSGGGALPLQTESILRSDISADPERKQGPVSWPGRPSAGEALPQMTGGGDMGPSRDRQLYKATSPGRRGPTEGGGRDTCSPGCGQLRAAVA